MKALVCEMCGAHGLIKRDGYYVCESCGTKYSTEESRKLLVEATVVIDDSNRIDNYLELARQARQAGNNSGAEEYCDKAIESQGDNYDAWQIKAETVGWQPAGNCLQITKATPYFVKAWEVAPSKDKRASTAKSFSDLCVGSVRSLCKRYATSGSRAEADAIIQQTTTACKQVAVFNDKTGNVLDKRAVGKRMATATSNAAAKAWNSKIAPTLRMKVGLPTLSDGVGALLLTKRAIELDKDNDLKNLERYENMLDMASSLMISDAPPKFKQAMAVEKNSWHPEIENIALRVGPAGDAVVEKFSSTSLANLDNWMPVSWAILLSVAILIVAAIFLPMLFSSSWE